MARHHNPVLPLWPNVPADMDADRVLEGGSEAVAVDNAGHRRVLSAGTLLGCNVRNAGGEDLGKVEEIMLDIPTGKIAYAVISFGGFMGLGKKLFAIPWLAFTFDLSDRCFILNVDQEKLKDAPGFDEDDWPNMADPAWASEVFGYYGHEPHWVGSPRDGAGLRAVPELQRAG